MDPDEFVILLPELTIRFPDCQTMTAPLLHTRLRPKVGVLPSKPGKLSVIMNFEVGTPGDRFANVLMYIVPVPAISPPAHTLSYSPVPIVALLTPRMVR